MSDQEIPESQPSSPAVQDEGWLTRTFPGLKTVHRRLRAPVAGAILAGSLLAAPTAIENPAGDKIGAVVNPDDPDAGRETARNTGVGTVVAGIALGAAGAELERRRRRREESSDGPESLQR